MTQEELDALMAEADGATEDAPEQEKPASSASEELDEDGFPKNYRVDAEKHWPPPPPSADHKMVQQLDDVTRDSEEKATQVLDMLDAINNLLMDGESEVADVKDTLNSNIEIFEKLSTKFSHIPSFAEQKDKCQSALEAIESVEAKLQDGQNDIMNIMDMMQYQDIHRQKIERVINVMRALAKYMNSLFESNIDDKTRAPSAVHLEGDKSDNLMSDDDIEALINSLGKK